MPEPIGRRRISDDPQAAQQTTACGAPSIVYPQGPADIMLKESAVTYPTRAAVHTRARTVTFSVLDAMVDRFAAMLHRYIGRPGTVVALASILSYDFIVGYYGILRSANVATPLNPYLREEQLVHLLTVSGAEIALVDASVAARLDSVRHRLPRLRDIVVIGPRPAKLADVGRTLREVLAEAGSSATTSVLVRPLPSDLACLHFTSGTTGEPKTVMLSHRNVTVNAAQVAHAHRLSGSSVMLNHLPTFHPMHMNSAILTGATQVLCDLPDPVESVRLANEYGATHYYSLPVRLATLADSPHLAECRLETVRVIASGGSALPSNAARTLAEHFGVPVIQGYGLAETSPLTHSDDPRDWRIGTVGRPVADTECRVVDIDSREMLGTADTGEIQVRGPQVMMGYRDDSSGPAVDADGWLSTGDVGLIASDGRLVLTDRLKDVFKRDNWLVSPGAVEEALRADDRVRDCVVVDVPEPLCGAVAAGFVVLAEHVADAGDESSVLRDLAEHVNTSLPYFQRLEHLEAVPSIPRSPNGKVPRRELRARMATLWTPHRGFGLGSPVT